MRAVQEGAAQLAGLLSQVATHENLAQGKREAKNTIALGVQYGRISGTFAAQINQVIDQYEGTAEQQSATGGGFGR